MLPVYGRDMSVLNKEQQILFLFLQFSLCFFRNRILYLHCHIEKESGSYRDVQDVSGGIVYILGRGSMDYSE